MTSLRHASSRDVLAELQHRDIPDNELAQLNMNVLAELMQHHGDLCDAALDEQRSIRLKAAGRDLTGNQKRDFDAATKAHLHHGTVVQRLRRVFDDVQQRTQEELVSLPTITPVGSDAPAHRHDQGRVLDREQRVSDWITRHGQREGIVTWNGQPDPHTARTSDLSLGMLLRGWVTGRWDGADNEQRALLEGTQAGGGVLVPTPLSADVIDRARNMSRCFQAGARIVPMDAQTLRVPRIAGSPNPAWRAENATIAEGDLTFDSITFTARSMALIVRCSRELLEDGRDVDNVVRNDLAAQVATELDRVMLRGTGTSPEPAGVRNTSGVTITAFGGANGAAPTNYDLLLDSVQVVRGGNHEPTAFIHSPRTANTLAKLKTTEGQYLTPPPQLAQIPHLSTNQIPGNLTAGTSTDTSEIYTGDWSQLWLGMRTQLMLTTLTERYADVGQVAFLIWMRADVQLAQPGAFNVITGVRP